jgi:hypothetical protein
MHRKRRESLTIRLTHQPEHLRAGSVNNPRRFTDRFTLSFVINRQCNPLDGFFF